MGCLSKFIETFFFRVGLRYCYNLTIVLDQNFKHKLQEYGDTTDNEQETDVTFDMGHSRSIVF